MTQAPIRNPLINTTGSFSILFFSTRLFRRLLSCKPTSDKDSTPLLNDEKLQSSHASVLRKKCHLNKLSNTLLLLLVAANVNAQNSLKDSLISKINQRDDIRKANALVYRTLAIPHGDFELLKREQQSLVNAEATGDALEQLFALHIIDLVDFQMGDLTGALNADLKGIRISKENRKPIYLGIFLQSAGLVYALTGNSQKSLDYFQKAFSAATSAKDTIMSIDILSNIETEYAKLKKPDSALYYARSELRLLTNSTNASRQDIEAEVMADMAEAMNSANQPDSALSYSREALAMEKARRHRINPELLNVITNSFLKMGQPDSAAKFGLKSYNTLKQTKRWDLLANVCAILSKAYEGRDDKKSLYYLKAQIAARDSSRLNVNSAQFQLLTDRDQQYEQELRNAREKLIVKVRLYLVAGTAFCLMIIGIILWRSYKRQKLNNHLLGEQKEQIEAQRDNLEHALTDLKMAQTQLIQSEKMASLGELTAGIAHEIQNPLNFVNNFSEVNTELIGEMKEEIAKGDLGEIKAIAAYIEENSKKINIHGKRADAIVKGMLEHSRTSMGQKEPTDINQLADEYMRLAYHGLRAKDNDFTAELLMHFDEKLTKVNAIPQDIGRVMLNLFNNAFYAVNQKKKTLNGDYKPEVTVTTLTEKGQAIIKVKDNGAGIPDAIKEKIMQPFFTTKPTGEGTGLGLSLTYDMVVKGHGGTIQVNSNDGEGSEFIISLPTN